MKQQTAREAWKLLLLSLPKGIGSFLFAVIGLSVGIAASAVIIGLPLLAFVPDRLPQMMEKRIRTDIRLDERQETGGCADGGSWRTGAGTAGLEQSAGRADRQTIVSRHRLLSAAASGRGGLLHARDRRARCGAGRRARPRRMALRRKQFEYELFADGWLFADWPYVRPRTVPEQSWIVGGFGFLLVLLVPAMIRMLGRST